MMIYVDAEFRCFTESTEGSTGYDVPFFDGKCRGFIEGYCYVPEGAEWHQPDGTTLYGEMISPWRDSSFLCELQAQYEEMLAQQSDMRAALDTIYGGDTDDGT